MYRRNSVALGVLAALLGVTIMPAGQPATEQQEMRTARRKEAVRRSAIVSRGGSYTPNRNARRKRAMLAKGVARAHI